jgi:hypothetical protein
LPGPVVTGLRDFVFACCVLCADPSGHAPPGSVQVPQPGPGVSPPVQIAASSLAHHVPAPARPTAIPFRIPPRHQPAPSLCAPLVKVLPLDCSKGTKTALHSYRAEVAHPVSGAARTSCC